MGHFQVSTLVPGERAWFLRLDGPRLRWALLRAFEDGSAAVRRDDDFKTYEAPNGPTQAVHALENELFVPLDVARVMWQLGDDVRPPAW
jgi:hypothetical protein